MQRPPERVRPGRKHDPVFLSHKARYEWAVGHTQGKTVLDAGCGYGYGTAILASHAKLAIATDLAFEPIEFGRGTYHADNLGFVVVDCLKLPFTKGAFEVVVSFEVIEHVEDDEVYLTEISRVLDKDGLLVLSTPNALTHPLDAMENPWHLRAYSPRELAGCLRKHFKCIQVYGQAPGPKLVSLRSGPKRASWIRLIQKLDILSFRTRIPESIRIAIGCLVGGISYPDLRSISTDDFEISDENVNTCDNLIALCRHALQSP